MARPSPHTSLRPVRRQVQRVAYGRGLSWCKVVTIMHQGHPPRAVGHVGDETSSVSRFLCHLLRRGHALYSFYIFLARFIPCAFTMRLRFTFFSLVASLAHSPCVFSNRCNFPHVMGPWAMIYTDIIYIRIPVRLYIHR